MKSKNIGYLLSEGFRSIGKHGFMSFAAVCVMVACMVIIGSFMLISYNIRLMIDDMEKGSQLTVYVDESYTTAEAKSIGTEMSRIDNIAEKTFVTRQQALENYAAEHDDPTVFAGVTADTFRDRYYITLEDNTKVDQTIAQLRAIDGVAEVKFPKEIFDGFNMLSHIVNIASVAIVAVLLVVSLLILSNTIKLAMYDRREEIAIMKMVGATNSFIRLPFEVQGMILGLLGGGLAFGLEWGLYELIANKINSTSTLGLIHLVSFQTVLPIMAILFVVGGLLVGVVGSLLSIRKFMDV